MNIDASGLHGPGDDTLDNLERARLVDEHVHFPPVDGVARKPPDEFASYNQKCGQDHKHRISRLAEFETNIENDIEQIC